MVITRGNWRESRMKVLEGIMIYESPFIPFFPPFHIIYHGFFVNRLLKNTQKDIKITHLDSPLIPIINTSVPNGKMYINSFKGIELFRKIWLSTNSPLLYYQRFCKANCCYFW